MYFGGNPQTPVSLRSCHNRGGADSGCEDVIVQAKFGPRIVCRVMCLTNSYILMCPSPPLVKNQPPTRGESFKLLSLFLSSVHWPWKTLATNEVNIINMFSHFFVICSFSRFYPRLTRQLDMVCTDVSRFVQAKESLHPHSEGISPTSDNQRF